MSDDFADYVDRLKRKAADFVVAFEAVVRSESAVKDSPALMQERAKLIAKGQSIKSTVEKITQGIDFAQSIFSSTTGEKLPDGLQGLGLGAAGALVPLSAIAAAIAYMGAYISDAYIYQRRVDEIKRLEQGGMTPAAAYSQAFNGSGISGFLANHLGLLTLIGLGVVFWPQIKKRLR